MDNTENSQDVNASHTSDGVARPNMLTREEFLRRVLYSGEVTQIAQHLAIVIFLVAEGKNQLNLSLRELEKITGWSRRAIADHLAELEIFVKVTLGSGRAKTIFEMQGVIEDALATAVVAGSRAPEAPSTPGVSQAPTTFVAGQPPTNFVVAGYTPKSRLVASHVAASVVASLAATTGAMASQAPTNDAGVRQPPAIVAAGVTQPATNGVGASQTPTNSAVMVRQAATSDLVAGQAPTTPHTERERESNYNTLSLSKEHPSAKSAGRVQLDDVGISGPGFALEWAAVDLAASMISMPKEIARGIAEICARDWASNGVKPQSPMAMVRRALSNDHNHGQVQQVRMEKAAKAGARDQSAASTRQKISQFAEKAEERLKKGART